LQLSGHVVALGQTAQLLHCGSPQSADPALEVPGIQIPDFIRFGIEHYKVFLCNYLYEHIGQILSHAASGTAIAIVMGSDHGITGKEIMNMKAIKHILALSAAALLLFGASGALAQGKPSSPAQKGQGIVDANGDGICDTTGQKIGTGAGTGQGQQVKRGNTNGPGNGTGNQGTGPKDGTGYGAQSGKRTGPQDGTQPRMGQGGRTGQGAPATGSRGRRGGRR